MRGALGTILRIFEPVDWQDGPSGLQDPPRPFVLRAAHLDGVTVRAGQSFHFDVHLFMTRERPPIETFVDAFSRLADTGLGPSRGRVRLEDTATELISIPLSNGIDSEVEEKLRIRFVTATELKQNGRIAQRPDFQMIVGARHRMAHQLKRTVRRSACVELARAGGGRGRGQAGGYSV